MYKFIARVVSVCFLGSTLLVSEINAQEVRDPTTPLGQSTTSPSTVGEQPFELNSILISPQRKLAIINGNALREGQAVPGAGNVRVQRISAQSVVLQQMDHTWELRLSPSVTKRH